MITISNLLISFLSVCLIFFWDYNNYFINPRYFFLILLFPLILQLFYQIKNKKYFFFLNFLIVSFLIFAHYFINIFLENKSIDYYIISSISFFLLIYAITYFYHGKIISNIDLIVKIFLIFFIFTAFYSIFNYQVDAPFFCGGIPSFVNENFGRSMEGFATFFTRDSFRSTFDYNLSFQHILFKENSHLGMIAPGVIIYSINKLINKKNNIFNYLIIILFIILCYIKSSTTLLAGTAISLLVITLFNFKSMPKKTIFTFASIFILINLVVFNSHECKIRFIPSYSGVDMLNNKITNFTKEKLFKDIPKKDRSTLGSLSSGIFFRSLLIVQKSLVDKPFGWGFNRYSEGFDRYNEANPPKIDLYNHLNRLDGMNNFNKIIVEFGYLSLAIFLFIMLYIKNTKINLEEKYFFVPLIVTQMIRGAGYFNGGFSLIVLLMIFSYINSRKK